MPLYTSHYRHTRMHGSRRSFASIVDVALLQALSVVLTYMQEKTACVGVGRFPSTFVSRKQYTAPVTLHYEVSLHLNSELLGLGIWKGTG